MQEAEVEEQMGVWQDPRHTSPVWQMASSPQGYSAGRLLDFVQIF
jgi:hypothetical protein